MIFVSLGTQKFQFNRILEYIDELIEENIISDQVFAQIGFSTYKPKNYQFSTFLSEKSFDDLIKNCTIRITHGGVSSINKGLINNKKIIVIPRSSSFNEHIDDHQKEFTSKLNLLTMKHNIIDEEYYEELEDILITADIGVNTVIKFIDKLRDRVKRENITCASDLKEIIVDEMFIIYVQNDIIVNKINYSKDGPTVILFVGVNGVGKTTTIGKIAYKLIHQKQ